MNIISLHIVILTREYRLTLMPLIVGLLSCLNSQFMHADGSELLQGDLGAILTQDTVITLQRSACFGNCPAYEVLVFGDGTIIFNGYENVKTIGPVKSRIDPNQVLKLLTMFRDFDYYRVEAKLNEEGKDCPEYWTDQSTASTSIKISGFYKEIIHYYGCQGGKTAESATHLEGKIDEILGTKKWIGI